jgi:hypothetical protein
MLNKPSWREFMKSIQLAKALSAGKVFVRTGRNVSGQTQLKFRNPEVGIKIITPFPMKDLLKDESFTNLSATYSADQLKNSNLEDLVISKVLELKQV